MLQLFSFANRLQNMMKAIHDLSDNISPEYILLDSLSNLTSYGGVLTGKVSTFIIDITNFAKLKHKTLIFLCNLGDLETFKFIFEKIGVRVDILQEDSEQ